MKKLLVILLIVVVFLFCGCNAKQDSIESEEERFVVEYHQNKSWNEIAIIRDTQTGVKYLFVHSGYAGGLTRLVEVDNGT